MQKVEYISGKKPTFWKVLIRSSLFISYFVIGIQFKNSLLIGIALLYFIIEYKYFLREKDHKDQLIIDVDKMIVYKNDLPSEIISTSDISLINEDTVSGMHFISIKTRKGDKHSFFSKNFEEDNYEKLKFHLSEYYMKINSKINSSNQTEKRMMLGYCLITLLIGLFSYYLIPSTANLISIFIFPLSAFLGMVLGKYYLRLYC